MVVPGARPHENGGCLDSGRRRPSVVKVVPKISVAAAFGDEESMVPEDCPVEADRVEGEAAVGDAWRRSAAGLL